MKKQIFTAILALGISITVQAKEVEQTICFSYDGKPSLRMATLGDGILLSGGRCQGKNLYQMNKEGWKLIQVVSGLDRAFGMVFIKE